MENDHDLSLPALHVVLGAGQVGARLAELLLARGHRVRLVKRGAPGAARPNLEWAQGDLMDLAFAEAATRGAAVVYDCMNPAYHMWPAQLLPMARGALHGAKQAGARLVALDCLYMYGRPNGPMREDSPMQPCSKKGRLRVELAELRLGADRRGDVRVAIGRASDFFGADLQYSAWSDRFYQRVLAGKPAECMGDPDQPHSYTYVEDIAQALVTLGERDEALGNVWHLPTPPAESTRALVERLGRALGLPNIRVARVPKLLLRAGGLFQPMLREMVEMTYQWEMPYILDDSKFRRVFGQAPTPADVAVAEVAAWARKRYQLPAAAAHGAGALHGAS
jgi:nucleoside-diphosphate-sugar epimerase